MRIASKNQRGKGKSDNIIIPLIRNIFQNNHKINSNNYTFLFVKVTTK